MDIAFNSIEWIRTLTLIAGVGFTSTFNSIEWILISFYES